MNLIVLLGAFILSSSWGIDAQLSGCPQDFHDSYGGSCYYFSTTEATWSEAKTDCEMKGGNLAMIENAETQIYLTGYVEFTNKKKTITLDTADDYIYHYLHDLGLDVTNYQDVTFMVQACHDAHIALSSVKNLDTSDTYEIVIGGWTDSQSVIRDCKQCAHMDEVHHMSHPLSCTDFRPFWISWDNHVIRVGTGNDVGENEFMSWNDTSPHAVNYVAIATGFGSSGNWTFDLKTYTPGKFWVGGKYVTTSNGWMWLPSMTPVVEFQNWAQNEPSRTSGNQQCLLLDMHTNMQWREEDCQERRNYICESSYVEPGLVG